MIKILKETFAILNKNLWLLFLFMTISYIGLVYFSVLRATAHNTTQITIGIVTLLFIVVAGVAGFFHTLRSTVDAEMTNDETPRLELLKSFPKGVSEYFLPAFGIIVIYLIITTLVFSAAMLIGKNLIGTFSFTPEELGKAMGSVEALAEFQKNVSPEDLLKLSKWHLLYLTLSSILTYLLIYWLPETFYKTKNSVLSLWRAVKKVVLNPLITLQLLITLVLINIITSVIMALFMPIPVVTCLVYFVYFYGLLYILILTFNFYRNKFVETEKIYIAEEVAEEEDEQEE